MIKYLHKITEEKYKSFFDYGKTWGWLMNNYKQPPWCRYPDALRGKLGCWSLIDQPWKINQNSCKDCDLMITEKDWEERKHKNKLNKFWKEYCN